MKKFRLGVVAFITPAAAVPALAADLPARTYTKAPANAAAPIYNWAGFYAGGHVGGIFKGNEDFAGVSHNNDGRFLGGVQVGGDHQFAPNWVVGVEGQYGWLGNDNNSVTIPRAGYVYSYNQRGLGSVAGRVGYT